MPHGAMEKILLANSVFMLSTVSNTQQVLDRLFQLSPRVWLIVGLAVVREGGSLPMEKENKSKACL